MSYNPYRNRTQYASRDPELEEREEQLHQEYLQQQQQLNLQHQQQEEEEGREEQKMEARTTIPLQPARRQGLGKADTTFQGH